MCIGVLIGVLVYWYMCIGVLVHWCIDECSEVSERISHTLDRFSGSADLRGLKKHSLTIGGEPQI